MVVGSFHTLPLFASSSRVTWLELNPAAVSRTFKVHRGQVLPLSDLLGVTSDETIPVTWKKSAVVTCNQLEDAFKALLQIAKGRVQNLCRVCAAPRSGSTPGVYACHSGALSPPKIIKSKNNVCAVYGYEQVQQASYLQFPYRPHPHPSSTIPRASSTLALEIGLNFLAYLPFL